MKPLIFVTAGDNSVTISVGTLTNLHASKTNSSEFRNTLERFQIWVSGNPGGKLGGRSGGQSGLLVWTGPVL